MTAAAIEVEGLSMRYPKVPRLRELLTHPFHREHVQALDGVSFAVPSGVLFAFLGPNGAGKTTLIKILTTLLLPSAGRARIAGFDVEHEPESVKRRIGVVMSDERSFYWRLSGRRNLEFFATLHGLTGRTARRRVDGLLELLGLSEKADERFSDYSSGMKQKLAIARGMISEPEILFFDEPTRSIDPIAASQIRGFIREKLIVESGRTVFLTTHNLHEAEEISDIVGIINRGRILAAGRVGEISARLRSRERFRLALAEASDDLVRAIAAVPGIVDARRAAREPGVAGTVVEISVSDAVAVIPEVIRAAVARGARILECAKRESTLTEIFGEIITEDSERGDAA